MTAKGMTAKGKPNSSATTSLAPVVLFGIDSRGKPKGARFEKEHATLAIKAASQLNLKVLASDDPKVADVATRLPVGRVHGNGRAFVPFIRQDLYDKLVAAAPNENAQSESPPGGSAGSPSSTSSGAPPNLPRNWKEIAPGQLVIAQESLVDGWWEAVVVECTGDMLTLRWRDYPKQAQVTRHRDAVALISTGI
jgi:hypothetical protein